MCIYQAFKVRKELPIIKYSLQYFKYMIPGIVMFIVLSLLMKTMSFSILHLLELVLIGGVIYVVVALLYMALFERTQLVSAVNKIKELLHRKAER